MMGLELSFALDRPGHSLRVDVRVPPGFTCVRGASGAGKTTLLRCLAGLEPNLRGVIRVNGVPWHETRPRVAPHQRGVGLCFQESRVLPHLSVMRNLRYGMRRGHVPPVSLEHVVEQLDLAPLLHRRGGKLSGGEARRVALGRALLCARSLLLLDEPLAGLDEARARAVRNLLKQFHHRTCVPIWFVAHGDHGLEGMIDSELNIQDGRVSLTAPAKEASAQVPDPRAAFQAVPAGRLPAPVPSPAGC